MTQGQLVTASKSNKTPVYDLIIIRMLENILECGNVQTLQFYLDIVIGENKILGGDAGGDGNASPVTVYEIPANGSENLDPDEDDL